MFDRGVSIPEFRDGVVQQRFRSLTKENLASIASVVHLGLGATALHVGRRAMSGRRRCFQASPSDR